MNSSLQNPLSLLARLMVALLFVPAGWSKIQGFAGTVGYIDSVGLPLPQLAGALAILIEFGAGIALVLGLGTRVAALALAVFTLVASFAFHHFWSMPADQVMLNQLMFFKNFAIAGGLLMLAAYGGGGWSLDAMRAGNPSRGLSTSRA
ncbi:MAG: DoxX family protein [Burkholderiaceae bacterium]